MHTKGLIKLFVDDHRDTPDGWETARTITAAIGWLATGLVEEISLDFNIADYRWATGVSNETFMPVAQYIAIMEHRPHIIRFHTGDPFAGQAMAKILGMQYDPTYSRGVL